MPPWPTDTIDLHDLVTILLHERLLTEKRFKHSRLLEINDGSTPRRSVPTHVAMPALDNLPTHTPHVAYFLSDEGSEHLDHIEPATFRHEDLITDSGLSYSELELIFWRCRHHDSGYTMAHALQLVLDAIPATTQLNMRTSQGYILKAAATNFNVAEVPIMAKSMTYICKLTKHPEMGLTRLGMAQYLTGTQGAIPWVYLLFGGEEAAKAEPKRDGRVAVDLISPLLGLRGLGGEIFVMERMVDMHTKVLPRAAWEGDPLTLARRIAASSGKQVEDEARQLSERVLARLAKIRSGDELFCGYCGRATPKSQCGACRKAKYCGGRCQTMGWKYHKIWCKVDGKSVMTTG